LYYIASGSGYSSLCILMMCIWVEIYLTHSPRYLRPSTTSFPNQSRSLQLYGINLNPPHSIHSALVHSYRTPQIFTPLLMRKNSQILSLYSTAYLISMHTITYPRLYGDPSIYIFMGSKSRHLDADIYIYSLIEVGTWFIEGA
jgi:hypothetical protein